MKEYCTRVSVAAKHITVEEMFLNCDIIELQKPAKAGEVINSMLILSEDNPYERKIINDFDEGYYVKAIPLRCIAICTSPFDLSEYSFEAIAEENGCTKWCHFKRLPRGFCVFDKALERKM